jgi:hypothetical protein
VNVQYGGRQPKRRELLYAQCTYSVSERREPNSRDLLYGPFTYNVGKPTRREMLMLEYGMGNPRWREY